jgi:hypothetical protein
MNNRIAKFVIILLSAVVAIVALFSVLRAGFAFWLYSHVGQWVTIRLGLDYYAAELLTVVITTAVMFAIPSFGSLVISRRKRMISAGLIVSGYVVMCVLVYTVGRNVYFNRVNGEPLRYYTDTPKGREFSFTPGFHPRYGIPYRPYTQAVVQEELKQMRIQEERRRKAEAEEQRRTAEEQKQREIAEQKRQEEERRHADAEAQQQQELEKQRLAGEAKRREELEAQQRETEAQRQYELELKRLEAQQQADERAREIERQKLEAEERQRERADKARESIERKHQDEERRRSNEEARRRREETTKRVIGVAQVIERAVRKRRH